MQASLSACTTPPFKPDALVPHCGVRESAGSCAQHLSAHLFPLPPLNHFSPLTCVSNIASEQSTASTPWQSGFAYLGCIHSPINTNDAERCSFISLHHCVHLPSRVMLKKVSDILPLNHRWGILGSERLSHLLRLPQQPSGRGWTSGAVL